MHALDVSRHAFEQIVGVARNPPGLQDERHRRDRFFERLQRGLGLALQLDQDKGNDFVAQERFVERGPDGADIAALAQGANPPPAWRLGKADPLSQLVVADTSIPLQLGQYLQVDVVEGLAFRHWLLLGIIGAPACQAR